MGHKDYCCVPGCGNRREDKSGLSFYSIPLKSHERYQAWLDAIGRGSDWLPTPHTRICSAHFVGGKKSNIPHSASYTPTLSLNLVQEGDNVTPKRRKRRSDNDFKTEMGRLSSKSDEYFRMPPTEVLTSPLEGLLDLPQQVSPVKAKVRKGLPFGTSPNSLLHRTDVNIANSLISKTDDDGGLQMSSVVETSNASLVPVTIKIEQGMGVSSAAAVKNSATSTTGLSAGGIAHTNTCNKTSSSSKTGTVYSVGSHVQLNVPNPATAFSISRASKVTSPEKSGTTSIQIQQPTDVRGNVATTILTPGGYRTVAQLLHEKRVVTNPEQSICKIESVAGGVLPIESVEKLIAAQQAAQQREPISTTWKDVSHMDRIFKDLERFWKQKMYTDVMIKVEEETIEAHKLVVAACSPYFTSLLASLPDAVITIHLPVKKNAMKCILTYMYSGLLKLEDTTVHDVAQTAKLLKMTKVRMLCEKFIEQHNLNKRVPCSYSVSVQKMMEDGAAATTTTTTASSGMHVLNRVAARKVGDNKGEKLNTKSRNLDNKSMVQDELDGEDSQGECMDDNLVIDEDADDNDGDGDGCGEAMDEGSSDEVKPELKSEETGDDSVTGTQDYENLDSILDQIQADEVKTDGADVGDFISKLLNVHDEINPQPGYPDASDDDEDEKPLAFLKRKNSLEKKQQGPFSHLCSICGWRFPSELTCAKHIETRHTGEMNGSKAADFIQHGRYDAVRGENRIYSMKETNEESDLNDSMLLKKETDSQDAASQEMGPLDGIATTISSHGGKPKLAYVCCYCASRYPNIELCRQHTLSCENKFKMLGLPKNVREEKDQTPKKVQVNPLMHGCSECDFTTANKRYMPFHMYYKHDRPLPDELSKINCGICDRKFPSKQALREHISVHEEGGHNCKFCNKSFKYSSSLRGHIQHKHLKEKVFACPKCPHRSKTATQHKVHLSMHERQKVFPCLHCSYQAVTRKNLDIHISQKHPGPPAAETGMTVEEAK
ncbi:zinc finger and BTB domain-containing protein 17-like [Lineus longissimus]|uniref:zinc finger and BTB domain-containing protein 17-like n=1 Tax=Lineus longissimus TaxID=88925 RepID=UPI00315DC162